MTVPERPVSRPLGMPATEWRQLISARPNCVLIGTDSAIDAVLLALGPHLLEPIWRWDPEKP